MRIGRREFLKALGMGGAALAAGGTLGGALRKIPAARGEVPFHPGHSVGVSVPRQAEGVLTPMEFLRHFEMGEVSLLPSGQTLREYRLFAAPRTIEVARGVRFPAWTFNGSVPGPTLRARQGDRMRITFVNGDRHPHTIHFHSIHPGSMDGVFEVVDPGGSFVYEFDAEPFGVHLYHCHVVPISKHIAKGLYGMLVIDPPEGRPPATEMAMVMNGFDVDFDGENEFYTVNGIASYYLDHPIQIRVGEPVRIYLANLTEFDPINSFHLHANFFRFFRTGTRLDLYEIADTVMMCQGERGILEFSYKYPGTYLFHAHQSEFSELGWVGAFKVVE